jgi:hypothetical protein
MTLINLNPEFRHHSFRSGRKKILLFTYVKIDRKSSLRKIDQKKSRIFLHSCLFP